MRQHLICIRTCSAFAPVLHLHLIYIRSWVGMVAGTASSQLPSLLYFSSPLTRNQLWPRPASPPPPFPPQVAATGVAALRSVKVELVLLSPAPPTGLGPAAAARKGVSGVKSGPLSASSSSGNEGVGGWKGGSILVSVLKLHALKESGCMHACVPTYAFVIVEFGV